MNSDTNECGPDDVIDYGDGSFCIKRTKAPDELGRPVKGGASLILFTIISIAVACLLFGMAVAD